jgi:hypothetical protein
MKKYIYVIIIPVLFVLSGCEKMFMEPNPETDNISIYNEFWKLADEKYSMWDNPDKGLDRDAIHTYTKQLVNNNISNDSLFSVLVYIIQQFKDGHSWLSSIDDEDLDSFYDFEYNIPSNLDTNIINDIYLKDDYLTVGEKGSLKYKLMEDNQIGYIRLDNWMDIFTNEDIDKVLNYFANTKGLIFDVRGNGGGDPYMAVLVARHFVDQEYYLGVERFKTGPAYDDFSEQKLYNTPITGVRYTKTLKVLTNIRCFSATTSFIYYLNPAPNVEFIGARTGGGSGGSSDGFLANGWHWQLSTSEFIDWEGRHLDNGFDPDIKILLDTTDTSQDEIIEYAIQRIIEE